MSGLTEFFAGFKTGMKEFGTNIGVIVNSILLLFVYLIGVGLTSLVAKLSGKRFLELKPGRKKSYWTKLDMKAGKLEDHYRQY
jgi:hypothetical protein